MDREPSLVTRRSNRRAFLAAMGALSALGLSRTTEAHDKTPTPAPSAAGTPETAPQGTPIASPVVTGPVFESTIAALKYLPPEIAIEAGTTVVWINNDVVAHTVTHKVKPEDQHFASPYLKTGEQFSYTFDKPGTYPVFCIPHPFMSQTVVVSEKS